MAIIAQCVTCNFTYNSNIPVPKYGETYLDTIICGHPKAPLDRRGEVGNAIQKGKSPNWCPIHSHKSICIQPMIDSLKNITECLESWQSLND